MRMYRPSRKLMARVFEIMRRDENYGEEAVPRGENGVSVDTAMLLITLINKKRVQLFTEKKKYDLKELVHTYCERLPFSESWRQRAYELIVMRYYSVVSQLRAEGRRVRKERDEVRSKVS